MYSRDEITGFLAARKIDTKKIADKLAGDKKVVVVCGPTAIGKSRLGTGLAIALDTDIISADSIQVYKGMDIGTDKSDTGIYSVRQYMVDIFDPDHKLTVKEFSDQAASIIEDSFFKKKKVPVLVGGSGMYIKALIDGIDDSPGENEALRKKIEEGMDREGTEKYYRKLEEVDSKYAARISKNDRRRILRALEVYMASGTPYSEFQKSWRSGSLYDAVFIGLTKERAALYSDIEKRVDMMFDRGLVGEVEQLAEKGYKDSPSLVQAVGYKEVLEYLEGGISLDDCREKIKKNSRRLAKKQMTWFRQDDRINWFSTDNYDNIFDLIEDSLNLLYKG